jgi:two-component system sensor kinase FixL
MGQSLQGAARDDTRPATYRVRVFAYARGERELHTSPMISRETQALMEAAVDAIVVIDHRGRITAVNDATRRMFGYRTDELLGENVSRLMPEPDRGAHQGYMDQYEVTGKAQIIGVGREVAAARKDGSVFPAHLSVGRIQDGRRPRFIGIVRDITAEREARATRERLARVAHLAMMGEMATAVAHEINQPLTALAAYAHACERYLAMPEPDRAELAAAVGEIKAEGERAAEIIRRLRRLVRRDASDRRPTDINLLLEELKSLIDADARAHEARVNITTAPNQPLVHIDPTQIQQVVLNVMRNAFEALEHAPAGTREVTLASRLTDDGDMEISVTDNGPGVAAAAADRLFEPFFTTKRAGTGLGLAMSRSIVEAHRGSIGVRPAEPRGTTFFVRLPALDGGEF